MVWVERKGFPSLHSERGRRDLAFFFWFELSLLYLGESGMGALSIVRGELSIPMSAHKRASIVTNGSHE